MEATALLRDFINGRESANGAFLAAKSVLVRGVDTDLCVLFLGSWAHAAFIQSVAVRQKLPEAWTLVHRAKSLLSDETPAEVASYIKLIEAHLMGSEGNSVAQEDLIRKTLSGLADDSPRRKFVILELASLLAQCGRLEEIESALNRTAHGYSDSFKSVWVAAIRFVNSVETGQVASALRLVPELVHAERDSFALRNFEKYRNLLELMRGIPDNDATPEEEPALPDWALVIQCLQTSRAHQALRWARLCEKKIQSSITGHGCIAFNLIRAELAEGNAEAAHRLLEMRRGSGNVQYMDDFFLTRMELLAGNHDAAVERFASLLKAVDFYKAAGRLDFELCLAPEIARDILVRLTRGAQSTRLSAASQKERAPADGYRAPAGDKLEGLDRIIGASSALASIREAIQHFAQLDVHVLITGETGTGKELVAKALHEAGPRRTHGFVAINCGAISESLLESELFGHEKGAFSGAATAHQGLFEEAGEGTIFLDEIGEISQRLQVALLRVLETGEIRPVGSSKSRKIACRIVASTNADLERLSEQNRFRKDILFRLRRLEIHVPPLRERAEDILPLADYFLNTGRAPDVYAMMSAQLSETLRRYPWPGNVRELRNAVEKMRMMNSDKLYYDAKDLDVRIDSLHAGPGPEQVPGAVSARSPAPASLDERQQKAGAPAATDPGRAATQLKRGKSRVRRLALLRDLFLRHELLTRSEVVKTLEIAPNTATHDLKILCDEEFIEKVKPSASPRSVYFVLRDRLPDTSAGPGRLV